jgi:hypothetical protein
VLALGLWLAGVALGGTLGAVFARLSLRLGGCLGLGLALFFGSLWAYSLVTVAGNLWLLLTRGPSPAHWWPGY